MPSEKDIKYLGEENFNLAECKLKNAKVMFKNVSLSGIVSIANIDVHIKIMFKEGWSSVHFKMDYYHDGEEVIVMGLRLENDTEYNKRIADKEKKLISAEERNNTDIIVVVMIISNYL